MFQRVISRSPFASERYLQRDDPLRPIFRNSSRLLKGQCGRISLALALNVGFLIAFVGFAQQPDSIEQERKTFYVKP